MADNPEQPQHHHQQQQQYEGVVNDDVVQQNDQFLANKWQIMTKIINTQIVEIRQEAIVNQPPAEPWINLRFLGDKYLAIAGNNIAVEVLGYRNQNYAVMGESYRVRGRPVVYDDGGQQRWMVENSFPLGVYYAMFSYGICGYSGPQAELLADNNGEYLLVIDQQSALELRNQSLNRADQRSQVYQLIWSAFLLIIMSSHLYQWSNRNDNNEPILDLRQKIYISVDLCIRQLHCAIRSKNIYLKAIVVVEAMDRLVLNNPSPPFRRPVPTTIDVPAIVTPNIRQSVTRITDLVQEITNSPMFTRDWQEMFDKFGNLRTSVPIVDKLKQRANDILAEQEVHLDNGQMFVVRVEVGPQNTTTTNNNNNNIQWTYRIRSWSFSDTQRNSYHVWPVNNFEPFQVMRYTLQNNFLPLYSHGLAGSCTNTDAHCGNNGFQVTTLNFPDVPELNHRRLYFVNRAMAMELRALFEILPDQPVPVMEQYHRWFVQLMEMSRLVCDLRQWYRSVAGVVDDDQWLQDIQNCSQQLFAIPDRLFQMYTIISRLEQLWYHSILVPHIQAREPKLQPLIIPPAVYLGKKIEIKKKQKRKDRKDNQPNQGSGSGSGSSGLAGQKPTKKPRNKK